MIWESDTAEGDNTENLNEDNLLSRKEGDQYNDEALNPNMGQRTSSRIRTTPTWMAEYDQCLTGH